MRLEHNRAATTRTRHTALIHKAPRRRRRPAHLDFVLLAGRRQTSVVPAALALAVEQVIVAAVLEHEGAFDGRRGRVVRQLVRGHAARERQRRGFHLRLVDVFPKRAPGEIVRAVDVDQVRVDGVVRLRRVRPDARGPVVRPRSGVH
ncbi:hypothetical protein RRF57_013247 [Xylaria bambusicola]|uniref:Uncharacterized protein n=1 Tax=Xylaria bambusicola TaxID=326684 RepID=A0AAN7ZBI1_9PEZI